MGRDLPFPAPPAPPGDLLDGDRVRPAGADVPFEAFAREQIERVPAIARRMRRPEDLVRDWMHEGLARLWEQEPPVEPAVRDRWLTTTVYRLHVDDLRARRRAERHRSEVMAGVEAQQGEATPERIAVQREHERLFEALVVRLAPREREVFLLRHDQELPLEEIAGRFDLDVEAVKYLLWKARRELKEAWARERAKDRFEATWAALAAAGIVLLLFVRRLFRRLVAPRARSRAGGLLASAALGLVTVGHEGPMDPPVRAPVSELRAAGPNDEPSETAERSVVEAPHPDEPPAARAPHLPVSTASMPASPPAPAASAPASSQAPSASAHTVVPGVVRPGAETLEMPTRILARARASLASGQRAAARAMLAEYKSLYPHNPLRSQYDKLSADAFAP